MGNQRQNTKSPIYLVHQRLYYVPVENDHGHIKGQDEKREYASIDQDDIFG